MQKATSNYVACWTDFREDKVVVVERDIDTQERFITKYTPPYYFFVPDEEGEHETIFGDRVTKVTADTRAEYDYLVRSSPVRFESDFSPKKRVLMDQYYGRPTPPVFFAFFDIEVDYKQASGFAGPANPYAPINAVTIYQSWTKQYITIAIPPISDDGILLTNTDDWDEDTFRADIAKSWEEHKLGFKPNVILVKDERRLLELFLDYIQDCDMLSGWNSEFYDIPYVCERIRLVMGDKSLRSLEYPGAQAPKKEMVNKFGKEEPIYKFSGRAHLDYKSLFEKFTFEGRTSYALGNIAAEELDIPKLEYEGTLEQLYSGRQPIKKTDSAGSLRLSQIISARAEIAEELKRRG